MLTLESSSKIPNRMQIVIQLMLIVPYQIRVIREAANNENNGVSTANPGTTGTLLVNLVCACPPITFTITINGNNPHPPSFSLTDGSSQLVIMDPGNFRILALPTPFSFGFQPSLSGDCIQTGPFVTTGTINAGQQLACTITD